MNYLNEFKAYLINKDFDSCVNLLDSLTTLKDIKEQLEARSLIEELLRHLQEEQAQTKLNMQAIMKIKNFYKEDAHTDDMEENRYS